MSKKIASKIKKIVSSYLNENEAYDFNLGSEIEDIIYRKAKDLPIEDQVNLYAKAIPLLLNTKVSKDDKAQLKKVLSSLENIVNQYVFETFIYETKIKLSEEDEGIIYNFFVEKGNFQCEENRKESLAVLIKALSEAHDAIGN